MAEKNKKVMLINVTHAEESRVALVSDGVLESFEIETYDHRSQKGNIYKGRIESIHPGLQAAFVDIGDTKASFLPLDELNFDLHPPRGDKEKGRLENHLFKGQEILVQVVRDAYGNKPPTVSTFFSLPGRYLVLTPHQESVGISRKLEDKQRERMRKIIDSLPRPEEHGVIMRTAAQSATKVDISRDLRYLLKLWEKVEAVQKGLRPPRLVFQERSLALRTIRDHFTTDVDELLVDDKETFEEILEFFETVAPHRKKSVRLYEGERPIFNKFNLEEQIENIFRRRVPLPSGGAVVFDTTEALTAVDVNSSRMRREGTVEDTALKCNVEAAEEIARQLRLRDMGGLVVIDFIDMRAAKHMRAVEKTMRDALKRDRARYDVTRISSLGLMEISRQRVAAEKSSLRYTDCPSCKGTGKIKTVEAAVIQALRRLQTRIVRGDLEHVQVTVPIEVAEYLLNQKRADLVDWEQRYGTRIVIRGETGLERDDVDIEIVARERPRHAAPAVEHLSRGEIAEIDSQHTDAEEGAEETEEASEDAGTATKKKRRRRGGRRRRKSAEGEAREAEPTVAEAAEASAAPEPDEVDELKDEPLAELPEAQEAGAESSSRKKRRRRRKKRKPLEEGVAAEAGGESPPRGGQPAIAASSLDAELAAPGPRPRWWSSLVAGVLAAEEADADVEPDVREEVESPKAQAAAERGQAEPEALAEDDENAASPSEEGAAVGRDAASSGAPRKKRSRRSRGRRKKSEPRDPASAGSEGIVEPGEPEPAEGRPEAPVREALSELDAEDKSGELAAREEELAPQARQEEGASAPAAASEERPGGEGRDPRDEDDEVDDEAQPAVRDEYFTEGEPAPEPAGETWRQRD